MELDEELKIINGKSILLKKKHHRLKKDLEELKSKLDDIKAKLESTYIQKKTKVEVGDIFNLI